MDCRAARALADVGPRSAGHAQSAFVELRSQAFESRRIYYCFGAVAAGAGSPVRRVCRRSWRPVRRSLRWVRRPARRCIPCVPVAAGAAAAGAASCASASSGASVDDSVKPNADPRPSRNSAFRRETSSLIIHLPVSRLSGPTRQSKTLSYEHGVNVHAGEPLRRPFAAFP